MKKKLVVGILGMLMMALFSSCKSEAEIYQEDDVKKEADPEAETIYTDEDIYIYSFDCGYLSEHQNLRDGLLLIETSEQLSYAQENYGLGTEEDETEFSSFIAEKFEQMVQDYPVEEYTYLVAYDEVSSGGYYLHADKIAIRADMIMFQMDDESYSPGLYDTTTDVMGGFFHMAAIPKEYLGDATFRNVVYPGL